MVKNNRDTKLVQKASEVIGENTTWVNLADQLKVDSYRYRDGYPEWHTSTPFRPMFLSYLWAIVEGQSLTGIPHRLEELPELARAFGFDPEDLPSESSFKPVRLERRFENLERVVKKEADQIRTIAAERGAPIGFDLASNDEQTGDDQEATLSERSIDRLLRKKGKQVLDEVKTVGTSRLV